jgi:hypothetical protein
VLGYFNLIDCIAAIAKSHVFTIIAVDVVALYGLCAYGSRQNVTASPPQRDRRVRDVGTATGY